MRTHLRLADELREVRLEELANLAFERVGGHRRKRQLERDCREEQLLHLRRCDAHHLHNVRRGMPAAHSCLNGVAASAEAACSEYFLRRRTYLGAGGAQVDRLTCLRQRQIRLQAFVDIDNELVHEIRAGPAEDTRHKAAGAFERLPDLGLHVR